MKKILGYTSFLERLGVPTGILEAGESIYDYIMNTPPIIEKEDDCIHYKFSMNKSILINDVELNKIDIDLEYYPVGEESIILAGAAVMNTSKRSDDFRYTEYAKDDTIDMKFKIVGPESIDFVDLINFFKQEKKVVIPVISHELKHFFDHNKLSKVLFQELGDYHVFSNTRFNSQPIDSFLFLLYYISNIETSVYSTELASALRVNDIKKSEFKDFLTENRIYEILTSAQEFNYSDIRNKLLQPDELDRIKRFFDKNRVDYVNDDDLVDKFLDLVINSLKNNRLDTLYSYLEVSPFDFILNKEKVDEIEKYFNSVARKIYNQNTKEFFDFWEKRFKFVADKVKRKLAKLYDMCLDDKKDKIHSKINDRSIFNPEIWNKYFANKK